MGLFEENEPCYIVFKKIFDLVRFIFSGVFFCLLSTLALGQKKDTVVTLSDVLIKGHKETLHTTGLQSYMVDSAALLRFHGNSLADVMRQNNLIFIKSYGLGGLATPAFRGSSAAHTAVLWNGFNLQSPMNGEMDLNLLPPEFVGEAHVQPGSNAAKWGSGSVGGSIHLANPVKFGSGFKAGLAGRAGSFSTYRQSGEVAYGSHKVYLSLKAINHSALNDFPFKNTFERNAPIQRQTNNEVKQQGALAEASFKISRNQIANVKYWFQDNYREVPPTMGQAQSTAFQQDWFHRLMSDWQYRSKMVDFTMRSAYFDERIIYDDRQYNLYTFSRAKSSVTEVETELKLNKNHSITLRLNNTYSEAVSGSYPNQPKIWRAGGFLSYKGIWVKEKLIVNATLREEFVREKWIPLIPYGGVEYKLFSWLSLNGAVSRSYRVPTFNDWFWIPGGNPNLVSETGISQEAGVKIAPVFKEKTAVMVSATVFNSVIDNRILWLPTSFGFYSPINVEKVWARGIELRNNFSTEINKTKILIGINYDAVWATNEKVPKGNENQLGKQLIFVPVHKGAALFSVIYRGFSLSYNHAFTGYRYTTADNLSFLPGFSVGDAEVSYQKKYKDFSAKIFIQANNIWNEAYQVLPARPMPQRHYLAGVAFQFYKPLTIKNNEN